MWIGRLAPVEVIGWFAATFVILVLAGLRLRKPVGGRLRTTLGLVALAAPLACLLASIITLGGRSHPVVQFNDESSLGGWLAWSRMWPVVLLTSLTGGLLAVAARAADRWESRHSATGRIAKRGLRPPGPLRLIVGEPEAIHATL